ncbi:acyl-[acyl-carrier-protein] thioesterase [Anaerosacchariphilus polymeriproducens]|uniref:Acyl-[acyl-carrier-protein] thioesterase n=1 Tax=Anaerosacchariphilus polymeriproducens TaxID=1812858 RepID=A0A371ASZ4_9FIRM|nr:acyl-ACP thioesterase domain-containing protein [Anaerosacchariphilus polymeriproducens]RDU22694.1 acyl-[acyl-carrier-protein] thioesterase [Anaerosacchariphilus polymeriproducens]
MYSLKSRVRFSEVDAKERLTLSSLVNYFQDVSTFHSEDVGAGLDYFKKKKLAWILNSWQIVIESYPKLSERIEISTWPYDFKGFYGNRNFVIKNEKGKNLAYANSIWVLMGLENRHPVKVKKEMAAIYGGLEEKFPMNYKKRKIKLPETWECLEPFPVRKYHIDTNNHVNNGQYIQMAKEFIPDDKTISQMRAEYRREAVLGDIIVPKLHQEENAYMISLCDVEGKPYAIVAFECED